MRGFGDDFDRMITREHLLHLDELIGPRTQAITRCIAPAAFKIVERLCGFLKKAQRLTQQRAFGGEFDDLLVMIEHVGHMQSERALLRFEVPAQLRDVGRNEFRCGTRCRSA